MRDVKLKWALKILKSRYFVVMTDKESAIMFRGLDPTSFEDVLALTAQGNDLERFIFELNRLAVAHRQQARKLMGTRPKAKPTIIPIKKPTTYRKRVPVNKDKSNA
jgi:hypothetical protein